MARKKAEKKEPEVAVAAPPFNPQNLINEVGMLQDHVGGLEAAIEKLEAEKKALLDTLCRLMPGPVAKGLRAL